MSQASHEAARKQGGNVIMASRHIAVVVLLFAISVWLMGCGGGAGGHTQTLVQRVQGDWVGTVHDPGRPAATKCEVTISGSAVNGKIQASDGTVLGTMSGTVDEDGSVDVNFEYEGESEGENGTIETGGDNGQSGQDEQVEGDGGTIEENEQIDIQFEGTAGGDGTDAIQIALSRK
jgi:hypothetical protein